MSDDVTQWEPAAGQHLREMLKASGLSAEERTRAEEQTLRILGRCREPLWSDGPAGAELVVGAVQSGKTLSFTALIAAAHDNGFPLVIVLAGTKTILRQQTYDRLVRDLRMGGDGGVPRWSSYRGLKETDHAEIARLVALWKREPPPRVLTTTVAVVMKNSTGLRSVRDLLSALAKAHGTVPTLFIDDEADQAGLNLAPDGEMSSTYQAIATARASAPSHSYVLYTATPQAPLLVSLDDALSPRSVTVLQHGANYVGGHDLFVVHRRSFVRIIDDIEEALDPDAIGPPRSLAQAFATYLVALAVAQTRGGPIPLSMLVHPSATRDLHNSYERWITSLRDRVSRALHSGDRELAEQVAESLLRPAFDDLARSGGTQLEGQTLLFVDVVERLAEVIDYVRVRVVNSDDGHEIAPEEWRSSTGWVVIGGNKLDRGFTVENLAITYMPRGSGVGNADTVQQRGRFFGYKRTYLGLLRGWFAPSSHHVFERYVEHEQSMRADLADLDTRSETLRSWRRKFLLDPAMSPTRRAVVRLAVDDYQFDRPWFLQQTHLLGSGAEPSGSSVAAVSEWQAKAAADSRDHRPADGPRNSRLTVPWTEVAPVVADWAGSPQDRSRLYALLILADQTGLAEGMVEIVLMNGADPRTRGLTASSQTKVAGAGLVLDRIDERDLIQVNNLMQGANPRDGSIYPGDSAFVDDTVPTIQVHVLDIEIGGGRLARRLALAVHVPRDMRARLLLQE